MDLAVNIGSPIEDVIVRQNLKHTKRASRVANKLTEVFDFWIDIVKAKTKEHNKLVTAPDSYLAIRKKAFEGWTPPKPRLQNKYISNMEALYGEILDKFEELSRTKQKRVLRVKYPIRLIYKLTNLKFTNVFPESVDNADFKDILLTTSFSKDRFIKR